MPCPKCQVSLMPTSAFPAEDKNRPLVMPENCAMNGSGTIYCIKDNEDGTAFIESDHDGQISAPFAIGYNSEIRAVSNNTDRFDMVYVKTDIYGGRTYRLDSATTVFEPDAWKKIKGLKVAYDKDLISDDGCNDTDWFFDDAPITVTAQYGALFLDDNIMITPEVVSYVTEDSFHETGGQRNYKDTAGAILRCALDNSKDIEEAVQIRSALAMLEGTEETLTTSKGPLKFNYANIDMQLPGGDIEIHSSGAPVSLLNVFLDPKGIGVRKRFSTNRLGVMFLIENSEGNRWGEFVKIDSEDKGLYAALLKEALARKDVSAQDRKTLEFVLGQIVDPIMPEWVGKVPTQEDEGVALND